MFAFAILQGRSDFDSVLCWLTVSDIKHVSYFSTTLWELLETKIFVLFVIKYITYDEIINIQNVSNASTRDTMGILQKRQKSRTLFLSEYFAMLYVNS